MSAPITLVVFGVSGDLASRKLLPALYWLEAGGHLPEGFHLVGAARREVTVAGLIEATRHYVGDVADEAVLVRLRERIRVVRMDSGNAGDYDELKELLAELEGDATAATRLWYLSVPAAVAEPIIDALDKVGLNTAPDVTTRLLMEKPFGSDLASARKLDADLHDSFEEEQIYRIDHYVSKQVAQNILPMRFHDRSLHALWDARHIERIEIEALEKIGIEGRADFYEQTGALRDIMQSHLLALTALTLMAEPADDAAGSIHHQRVALLQAVEAVSPDAAQRGQYEGYRKEVGNPDSHVETYASLTLRLNDQRWQGVPVVLTAGKALAKKLAEVRITFKPGEGKDAPRCLRFRLQPNEAIELELADGTVRSIALQLEPLAVGDHQPDAYERVLVDAMVGDRTNFTCGDEVLETWRIVEPVLQAWQRNGDGLVIYPVGSSDPTPH